MVKRVPALLACGAWMTAWWTLYPTLGPKIKAYGLSQLGTTADYFFTYFGPELLIFLFGLVVLPLLYVVLIRRGPWWVQATLIPALLVGFIIAAYYDVVKIAHEAEHLCTTEAGLHVYETVEAEGVYGLWDIEYWSRYGLKWIEYSEPGGRHFRLTLREGEPRKERIDVLKSIFEYRSESHVPVSRHMEKSSEIIANRVSGSLLAEATYFHIFRGWADQITDVGFKFTPPMCIQGPPIQRGGDRIPSSSEFVKLVIRPEPT
jgi:hypothetical protein